MSAFCTIFPPPLTHTHTHTPEKRDVENCASRSSCGVGRVGQRLILVLLSLQSAVLGADRAISGCVEMRHSAWEVIVSNGIWYILFFLAHIVVRGCCHVEDMLQ